MRARARNVLQRSGAATSGDAEIVLHAERVAVVNDRRLLRLGLLRGFLLLLNRMLLERTAERDDEVVAVGRGRRCGLLVDVAADDEVDQRLRQRLHLEEGAL